MSNTKTKLFRARVRSGLMQSELARQSNISLSMMSRYENGWAVPSRPTASRISKVLGCSIMDLFGDVREDRPVNPDTQFTGTSLDPVEDYLVETLGKPEDAAAPEKGGSHVKTIHLDEAIEVMSMDRPGPGGLCHQYEFFAAEKDGVGMAVGSIHFQEGRVEEVGVNGVQHESLMSIIIDRLRTLYVARKATNKEKSALAYMLQARDAMTTEESTDE